MKRNEKAITLIALIITIIILVILAAVSIRAVYNMGIVNYAVNGAEGYGKAAKEEEKTMQDVTSFLDETIKKLEDTDYSAKIEAYINSDGFEFGNSSNGTYIMSDGTILADLGPEIGDYSKNYLLYEGGIYIANINFPQGSLTTNNSIEIASRNNIVLASERPYYHVSKTTKSPTNYGYNPSTGKITIVHGEFTPSEVIPEDTTYVVTIGDFEGYYLATGYSAPVR